MARHRSVSSPDLVDRIAQDIQCGHYGPGSWLKQIDLQTRYSAPRPEVRKALDQLALKRLIEHIPNRGYHVHVPDSERLDKIRDIRILLECGAATQVIEHITPAQINQIRQLAERFAELVETGTLMEQYEANLRFHRAIYALCPNDELVRLIQEIRSGMPSAPTTQWRTHARILQSAQEHFGIVDALAAGDLPRLQQLIAQHISQSGT
ncbi:GntR family transcriptional regulator [Corticimicrobacter populi]|uniref:GntR family transcriptional regulator n=1 Tax=Corticimicrobacter populi TaxID=2175229 RepID=A0A2V1K034_9BURK|nr:GntR family transcriptional regulator [Corticimicrobacter populi]PWF21093.1 GntR family transcriptional regulator [Corticimicrobacter populi]